MNQIKKGNYPLAIIILLMVFLSGGAAFSCSSSSKEKKAVKKDSTNIKESVNLDQNRLAEASLPDLSANFVQRAINGESVEKHMKILKNMNPDTLEHDLDTDRKRLTFWINTYNGFTQYFLKKDDSLYKKDRNAYFKKDQIHIAGSTVSFNTIEHGILRKGAKIWSKGYVRTTIFGSDFVKRYKMDTVDFRIHFALNCGAKSCPPIVVYQQKYIAQQLNDNTRYYLNKVAKYDKKDNIVKVPAFMNWFSADFGGSDKEKRQILKDYGALPKDADPKVKYLSYDWTPQTKNYKSYDLHE